MSGAAIDYSQAELDLQRAMDLFDTALTSKDERVVNALRSLLMIVALTNPEGESDRDTGPLRQMERDINSLHSRIRSLEENLKHIAEVLNRDDSITRAYRREAMRPYDTNPWNITASDSFYMNNINNISKKLNGGSV